jgi:hypothetical protein
VGGIERAGIVTVARTRATCLVGSGEGIGVRRTGTAIAVLEPWVARAGVVARARVTVFAERVDAAFFFPAVWRAFGLADGRAFGFVDGRAFGLADGRAFGFVDGRAFGLADGRAFGFLVDGRAFGLADGRAFGFVDGRALERDLPLTLLRDAAAFNCFPLLGLTTPRDGVSRPVRSTLSLEVDSSRAVPSPSILFSRTHPMR